MTEWKKGKKEGNWQEIIGTAYFCERKDKHTGRWSRTGRPYTKEEAEEVLEFLKSNSAKHFYSDFRVIEDSWKYWGVVN